MILITGSEGFAQGNCLVFFPENVAAHHKITEQPYAMVFYNKMQKTMTRTLCQVPLPS